EQYLFAFEPGTLTGEGSSDVDSGIGEWTFDASTAIQGQPSIADGVVYVGTRGGLVHAIDLETGDEVWRFDVGSPVRGSVAPIQGAVLVSTSHGEIIAITGD
ncbi:MAG: PQQ-binding-like beta-propeller repeat protein, partial [Acidimicrobiia bacterium]|nr:PQQ-binding-like beta-propeller repeat protein [Acidimicrobiia bacterium]